MIWQDVVLAGGQWVFIIALLPSVFGKDKPALLTSIITAAVLALFAFTLSTLSLWVAAFSTLFTATAWTVLAVQKFMIMKR